VYEVSFDHNDRSLKHPISSADTTWNQSSYLTFHAHASTPWTTYTESSKSSLMAWYSSANTTDTHFAYCHPTWSYFQTTYPRHTPKRAIWPLAKLDGISSKSNVKPTTFSWIHRRSAAENQNNTHQHAATRRYIYIYMYIYTHIAPNSFKE